jgi:hypothetical protein
VTDLKTFLLDTNKTGCIDCAEHVRVKDKLIQYKYPNQIHSQYVQHFNQKYETTPKKLEAFNYDTLKKEAKGE